MPELPEVETVRRGLLPLLQGRTVAEIQINRPDLRWPLPSDLVERLTGAAITDIMRRAKYLLLYTDKEDVFLVHLGMTGKFVMPAAGTVAGKHDHVVIMTDHDAVMMFHDPRRFGAMDIVSAAALASHPWLRYLGVEPLLPDFHAEYFQKICAKRTAPIKTLLMDQHKVVGVGNIYASESLFDSQIHPTRPAGSLRHAEIDRLVAAVKETLAKAIAAGGSSLRDYAAPGGELGCFQHQFKVYGRQQQPCIVCSTLIQKTVQAGRASFYCPACQPLQG